MDARPIDTIARALGRTSSRKQAIGLLAAGLFGGIAGAARLDRAAGMAARDRTGDTGDTGDTMEPDTAELSAQNAFVRTCRANGGTSTSVRTRVVKCCYKAFCTTCDYNVEPAACKDTINRGGNPQADNPGGVLTETP